MSDFQKYKEALITTVRWYKLNYGFSDFPFPEDDIVERLENCTEPKVIAGYTQIMNGWLCGDSDWYYN